MSLRIMLYEEENQNIDAEIRFLEHKIKQLMTDKTENIEKRILYETRLNALKERRNQPKVNRMLRDADMYQVSGRVWSMNEGCFLWILIFWAICFLLSIPFLLSSSH